MYTAFQDASVYIYCTYSTISKAKILGRYLTLHGHTAASLTMYISTSEEPAAYVNEVTGSLSKQQVQKSRKEKKHGIAGDGHTR